MRAKRPGRGGLAAIGKVVVPAMTMTVVGLIVGGAAAAAGVRLLRSFIWGVDPGDPITYGAVAIALLTVHSSPP